MKLRSPRSSGRPIGALAAVTLLCLLALVATGCGGEDPPEKKAAAPEASAKRAATVNIESFKFGPRTVTVRTGGTVTFVNRDKAPHTAQTELNAKAAEFDTERLGKGARRTVELRNPGRFAYFCAYHRFMEGTVKVVE
jgi:plastocyanin